MGTDDAGMLCGVSEKDLIVIRQFHEDIQALVGTDDGDEYSNWFYVTQVLGQGWGLSKLVFGGFLVATIDAVLVTIRADSDIARVLAHFDDDGVREIAEQLARTRRAFWDVWSTPTMNAVPLSQRIVLQR